MKVLLAPIMGPISGVVWIAEKIQERTNTEFDAQENLHKRLLSLQLAFDIGEISEEDFEAQEEEILLKIQALEEEARREAESEVEEYYEQQPQFTATVTEVEKAQSLVLLP
jgi:hypothetical protein